MHASTSSASRLVKLAFGLCMGAGLATAALAWELEGTKSIVAMTRDQQRIDIGSVAFKPKEGGQVEFSIHIDHAKFKDFFLSMREFKCLEGPEEIFCHVPYPYRQPGFVKADDFAWLEHSLMFLFKRPKEFGAKLLNGIYFRFSKTDTGLVGKPQAIDLNLIGAPPDDLDVPPYSADLRSDIEPGARWIESLHIE